jgi:kynurenine formamidase
MRMLLWAMTLLLGTVTAPVRVNSAPPPSTAPTALDSAYEAIHAATFVDLTHSFAPGIPHFSGFPDEETKTLATVSKDGYYAQVFTHVGQWGTHVDSPAHFHNGLKTVDQIDVKEFFLRLVVLDVHTKVAANADYGVTMVDVREWEARHGLIPRQAFVALRTDWAKRWPNKDSFQNRDTKGVNHTPGWSMDVLKYLFEQRDVTAIGHETSDTDPGILAAKGDYALESYVLGTNRFQIEMLDNLDKVPESGALVLVSFPKPDHGSGFPARVVAVRP